MTNSLKAIYDLSLFPPEHLKLISAPRVFKGNKSRRRIHIEYGTKQNWRSPITNRGMEFKVLVDQLTHTPKSVVLDINVPSATVGQNAETGHSVLAASDASLSMVKLFLAQQQVPLSSLDSLTLDRVQLLTVVITYLLPAPEGHTSQDLIEQVQTRVDCLHQQSNDGKRGALSVPSKGSRIAPVEKAICGMRAYLTPVNKTSTIDEAMIEERTEAVQPLICFELTLNATTLKKEQLNRPNDWADAHEHGVYQRLFDKYVRGKALRLDDRLRQDAPDLADLAKLTDSNRHIVSGYLVGKKLEDCKLLMRDSMVARQKLLSKHRLQILQD